MAALEPDVMTSHNHGLVAKYSFKMVAPNFMNFFRIVGTPEAETLESGKTECLLYLLQAKTKRKLFVREQEPKNGSLVQPSSQKMFDSSHLIEKDLLIKAR